MIVLDASVALESLLRKPGAVAVDARLFSIGQSMHAPHLLDVEVAQVIRRHAIKGEITAQRGQSALNDLAELPIRRYPHELLLPRIWELRNNLTAYDAAYVALAELLNAPLLTLDARLASAAGNSARIELISV